MVRAMAITGFSPGIVITLIFALVPVILGTAMLRLARKPAPWTWVARIELVVIAVLGTVFWAGLLAGPALALIAALIPDMGAPFRENR
jgi:hypothetical protein